jgi:hypothetical protein
LSQGDTVSLVMPQISISMTAGLTSGFTRSPSRRTGVDLDAPELARAKRERFKLKLQLPRRTIRNPFLIGRQIPVSHVCNLPWL